jgi:plasmid stabilization system protein ParE
MIDLTSSAGGECAEVRQGYRMYPGSHVLFYRQTSDAIDVVRILHERMGLPTTHRVGGREKTEI